MLFSSLVFILLFLPLTLLLYFLRKNLTYRNTILLLASLFFYAWGEPIYVLIMIGSIIFNYFIARAIARIRKKYRNKKKAKTYARALLITAVIVNIGLLGVFKYTNFLLSNIDRLLPLDIPSLKIIMPIGISFYTFQILSYVIDVYRRNCPAQKSLVKLGVYISLFPQLIAGPIVRYIDIEKQLTRRTATFEKAAAGLRRFVIGLAKKVIIANQMAIIADTIYKLNPEVAGTPLLWLAVIAYALQIYFDFSGYSDMAIGLGKIFGFDFLENFNYPYISRSITDFWRRWHMSLSTWFRDYVYIPLGGNRVAKARWILNIMIVWGLTGLWHGAAWNFILWGLYFGIILLIEKLWLGRILQKLPSLIQRFYMIILILFGWVLFRVEGLRNIAKTIKTMFIWTPTTFDLVDSFNVINALPYIIIGLIACTPILRSIKPNRATPWLTTIALILLFYWCLLSLLGSTYNPFIYFRF